MAACLGMAILCAVRVIHWTIVFVSSVGLEQRPSCTGDECFEVFSCYGLKDTTAHIMEPLAGAPKKACGHMALGSMSLQTY